MLGHFEFAVLSAVRDLKSTAYAAEIARTLQQRLGRRVSLSQVFIALERLHEKGYVSAMSTDPMPVRGGRSRRVFNIEDSGQRAWVKTAAAFNVPDSSKMKDTAYAEPTRTPQAAPA